MMLSQARRRVIVVRRNDLEKGDTLSSTMRWVIIVRGSEEEATKLRAVVKVCT